MPKLNQVLAIERNVKSRTYSKISELHKAAQKESLFNGFSKQYTPKTEEDETFPPEAMRVQFKCDNVLKTLRKMLVEYFDITATKDVANTRAKADLKVGDTVIAEDVPATTLLFLEKQLKDIHTFVSKIPTLDPAITWTRDEANSLFKSEPVTTAKTKKIQKPIVLYQATPEHPAQTQLITEDQTVGNWETIKQSGAMRIDDRDALVERIEQLQKAVKFARENANAEEAENITLGDKVFDYLLG